VWGLKGEELFVFPACTVGATYTVPLPSKGTQFTCFTGTKLQILALKAPLSACEFVNVTVVSTSSRFSFF
jgi:hypothetical protein